MTSSKQTISIVALVAAFFAALPMWPAAIVQATHSESYVFPGAPFSGTWNLGNNAPPAYHSGPWGGHWATDFYQYPGTWGYLYMASNDGSGYGRVVHKGSSCSDPNEWAGWAYKFNLENNSGTRGWLLYAHVHDQGGGYWHQLSLNYVYVSGSVVGWTGNWDGEGLACYQVSYDNSNHFHVEMAQSIGSNHFSCYYNYSSSQYLWAQDWLGIVGANTPTLRTAC